MTFCGLSFISGATCYHCTTAPLCCILFICILSVLCTSAAAYSSGIHHSQRLHHSSRYFTGEIQLPSLYLDDDDDTNNDLHVLYTNDPAQVSLWLADHVPSAGCTLGFDVEVGDVVLRTLWGLFL